MGVRGREEASKRRAYGLERWVYGRGVWSGGCTGEVSGAVSVQYRRSDQSLGQYTMLPFLEGQKSRKEFQGAIAFEKKS